MTFQEFREDRQLGEFSKVPTYNSTNPVNYFNLQVMNLTMKRMMK